MSELFYQWGSAPPEDFPVPPSGGTVTLIVEDEAVWTGDVSAELRAWARWCALQVADWWSCPDIARRYLVTGDESLRNTARELAEEAIGAARDAWRSGGGEGPQGDRAVAAWDAAGALLAASDITADAAVAACQASELAQHPDDAKHLRVLLLQRALPEEHWPLIDDPDECRLCEALARSS